MSKVFKTPKGTELPLLNLKGKDYLQVAHRLVWFREEHPDACIRTTLLSVNDDQTLAQAEIHIRAKDEKSFELRATGIKRETKKDFPDHTEKAETGAIGRALALMGFGTQFAIELDEGARIVDAPVPPSLKSVGVVATPTTLMDATLEAATKPKGFRRPGEKAAPKANTEQNNF